jgi:hypothetical protein
MNLQIEQSVRAWLADQEAFEGIAIHCGQSDEEIPSDAPLITVACEDINTPAATLYIASLRIIVGSPSVIEGSLDSHRSLVASLRATLADAEDMAEFFPIGITCAGASVNTWNESQGGDRWLSQVNLTLGLVEA